MLHLIYNGKKWLKNNKYFIIVTLFHNKRPYTPNSSLYKIKNAFFEPLIYIMNEIKLISKNYPIEARRI